MSSQDESEVEQCDRCGSGPATSKFLLGADYDGSMKSEYKICDDCTRSLGEWFENPEPQPATDGGEEVDAELHHCQECEDDVPATWDGGVLTCDVCDWVIYK